MLKCIVKVADNVKVSLLWDVVFLTDTNA